MSEAGWRAFLDGDDLTDWAVLHGGPTAVFRTVSLGAAGRLAAAIAELPALGARTVITLTPDAVTVKLSREVWATEEEHVDLARAVSALAREHRAPGDPAAVQEVQVAIAAHADAIDLPFWRAVLGYAPMDDDNGIDPLAQGSTVWMQEIEPAKALRHAMHLDVSVARDHARVRVDAALAAGGRIVDDSEAPATWILADRSGNKVCVASWPDGASPAAQG